MCVWKYARFLVNVGKIGWQNTDWNKAELSYSSLYQGKILNFRLVSSFVFESFGGCSFFFFWFIWMAKIISIYYQNMDTACFTCDILALGTQQLWFWNPTRQFKQYWSFLLVSFPKCQFCVIIFHLPIKCQQCHSRVFNLSTDNLPGNDGFPKNTLCALIEDSYLLSWISVLKWGSCDLKYYWCSCKLKWSWKVQRWWLVLAL